MPAPPLPADVVPVITAVGGGSARVAVVKWSENACKTLIFDATRGDPA
jgi:hypothetical protein